MTERHAPSEGEWTPDPAAGSGTGDAHAHTTRSDGVLEPDELVRQAFDVGVRLFAITDHDNLAGYREVAAAGVPAGLDLVPGVEINAVTRGLGLEIPGGELHVLGLGVDPDDEAFEAALAGQRAARRARFEATLQRLRDANIGVDRQVEALDLTRDDALGRPTVARALIAAGYAESVQDAFERILGYGMPGYVPRQGLGPVEAIRAIRAAGGLASLAHFPEAHHARVAHARPRRRGAERARDPPLRRSGRRFARQWARSRGRWGWWRPAGPTTTATTGRTRRATPGW